MAPSMKWAHSSQRSRDPRGFTLLELLVVLGVLGALLALLAAAVQASRESARATQCRNNLRQISLALVTHHTAHSHFPSGGWSYRWLAEPGAGNGKNQPGSWIDSILPELEEEGLHNLGVGANATDRHTQLIHIRSNQLFLTERGSRSSKVIPGNGIGCTNHSTTEGQNSPHHCVRALTNIGLSPN
jgi:prepilin-type N-terminal cleavage/methylation domain-containing protein